MFGCFSYVSIVHAIGEMLSALTNVAGRVGVCTNKYICIRAVELLDGYVHSKVRLRAPIEHIYLDDNNAKKHLKCLHCIASICKRDTSGGSDITSHGEGRPQIYGIKT